VTPNMVRYALGDSTTGPQVLLTLDAGTAHPAMAQFVDGRVSRVVVGHYTTITRNPQRIAGLLWDEMIPTLPDGAVAHFAAEWPIPYRAKSAAHKDVARLQAVVEELRARFAEVGVRYTRYTPTEWKGGV
jgi:hypothetical protein